MIAAVMCFAVVNTIAKWCGEIPPHELMFFRSAVSIVYCVWYLKRNNIPLLGNNRFWLLTRSVVGLCALFLFFLTIRNMPLASASTIQYLSPVFTILAATRMNGQKVKSIQFIWFAVAFVGILLMKGFDTRIKTEWLLVGIASAICTGVAYNAIIKSKNTDHPMVIIMYVPLVGLPATGIWCLFDWVPPTPLQWVLLLIMGAFGQIAQYLTTLALHSGAASKIAPWNYTGAIFALLIGWAIFHESPEPLALVGIVIVCVALILNSRVSAYKN